MARNAHAAESAAHFRCCSIRCERSNDAGGTAIVATTTPRGRKRADPVAKRSDAPLDRARRYLLSAFARKTNMARAVALSGMSRDRFRQCYVSRFGVAPLEDLMDHRLRIARSLLLDSQVPAWQVGAAVGFRSRSAFVRSFTRRFGVSPVRWREQTSARVER
jgi:AraC-like DNA-binding protein